MIRFPSWLTGLVRDGLNVVYPPTCANCGDDFAPGAADASEHYPNAALLCTPCIEKLTIDAGPRCRRCGERVSRAMPPDVRCARCRRAKLRFTTVLPLATYRNDLRRAVLRLKKPEHDALAIALANLYWREQAEPLQELGVDLVAPVPMHWWHRAQRGVNSAEYLAEVLAARLRVPHARWLLVRRRNTPVQADLALHERFSNVRDAFRIGPGYDLAASARRPARRVDDKFHGGARVLLVDDIMTTGATCHEAARALQQAGAAAVHVAVWARAESF